MKLNEIFNTQITQTNHPKDSLRGSDWKDTRKPNFDDEDTIGFGSAYRSKTDREDPHLIDKESIRVDPSESQRDGLRIYAQAIITNKLAQENPFFPRFYGYHVDEDSGGNKFYKFKMEKLIPASDLSFESVLPVLDHIFSNERSKKRFIDAHKDDMEQFDLEGGGYSAELLTDDIGIYLGDMMANGNYNAASDELNKALELINKLRIEHNLSDDLHQANIMYRATPAGVQLVINDPLA